MTAPSGGAQAGGTAPGPASLVHELLAVQDAERDRIFAGLHDDTIQVLAALGLRVMSMRREPGLPARTDAELADVARELAAAGRRLRRLVTDAEPEALGRDGLQGALATLLVNLVPTARHDLVVEADPGPPAATARVLYEVAVEAVRNVARHARATCVVVRVAERDGAWELVVRDDGVGSEPGAAEGLGRRSMRNRVGVASGTLEVRTAPGAGTTVTARVPTAAWALDAWHPDGGSRDMRSAVDAILHGVSDPFIALDTEWRFVYLNDAAATYFGRPADELLGRGMWDVFPEGVGRAFHTAYHRAMAEQRSLQVEEYYEPWDRWYENRIVPSPRGVTIFFSDVTDRHRLRQDRSVTDFGVAVTEAWSTGLVGHGDAATAVRAAAEACVSDRLARGVRVRAGDLVVEVGETEQAETADLVVGDSVLGTFAVTWTRPADDTTARLTRRTAQMVSMRLAQAGMRSNGEE